MTGLVCPACQAEDASTVKDSRANAGGWRRRRVCVCGHRFTTLEVVMTGEPVTFEQTTSYGLGRYVVAATTDRPHAERQAMVAEAVRLMFKAAGLPVPPALAEGDRDA